MVARSANPPRAPAAFRVLAVDADASFLTAVKRVLESSRTRVDCAGSAAEARAYLARHRYDLVIADAEMPGLEARRLFERLEEQRLEGLHLLFLAARPPAGELAAFLDRHRLTCLSKPLHLRRFLDKVEDFLLLATQPPEED